MSTQKQLSYIQNMVEDLINENAESSQINFHAYLQEKAREIVLGEMCDEDDDEDKKDDKKDEDDKKKDEDDEDDDEDDKKVDEGFSQPSVGSMSSTVGKIQYKKGGKKTAKRTEKAPKVGKMDFKKGGKQPAKVLEKTPKPSKFSDGRDYGLGTT